jgi:DNA-binding NtrC family response regulator
VLVEGESGTGKELVARAVHEQSQRASGPFVTLDLRTVPREAIEIQLFGTARTLGTPDQGGRDGSFRAASGGTLFLDEVGELDPAVQAKLLRVVESKEVLPVGAERGIPCDVRVVASTQHDLDARCADGRFRTDLLHRLGVVRLCIPPLRERRADVPTLAAHLLDKHAATQGRGPLRFEQAALDWLEAQPWPGNVRELSNMIERAVMFAEHDVIDVATLGGVGARSGLAGEARALREDDEDLTTEQCNLERAVGAFERRHVERVLRKAAGNRELAAKLLGLSSATFYRVLSRTNLKGYRLPPR